MVHKPTHAVRLILQVLGQSNMKIQALIDQAKQAAATGEKIDIIPMLVALAQIAGVQLGPMSDTISNQVASRVASGLAADPTYNPSAEIDAFLAVSDPWGCPMFADRMYVVWINWQNNLVFSMFLNKQ